MTTVIPCARCRGTGLVGIFRQGPDERPTIPHANEPMTCTPGEALQRIALEPMPRRLKTILLDALGSRRCPDCDFGVWAVVAQADGVRPC